VLSASDVTLPSAAWTRVATNQFDASGNCAISIPFDPSQPARYYRLQVP